MSPVVALPVVVIELGTQLALARDLAAGRVFVVGCSMQINTDCEVIVRGAQDEAMMIGARVVFVDEPRGVGLELLDFTRPKRLRLAELVASVTLIERVAEPEPELELAPHSPAPVVVVAPPVEEEELEELVLAEPLHAPPPPVLDSPSQTERRRASVAPPVRIAEPATEETSEETTEETEESFEAPTTYRKVDRGFVRTAPSPAPAEAIGAFELAPDGETLDEEDDDDNSRPIPRNVHERVRGLTLAEQIKTAHSPDPQERIALERLYGKNVWEALLRNPRLTVPEVVRLARMGTMPRVLLEVIVGNGAWVGVPEVRRALLANARLATDQIPRVLRAMPKHELKLASTQAVYPMAVREAAKRLMRGDS